MFENRSRSAQTDAHHALLSQAERFGIETHYVDARGEQRTADPDTVRRVVQALSDGGDMAAALATGTPRAMPAFSGTFERAWGLSVQLYGLRSARNWGHGDFTDLRHLIELASGHGAAAIGLNPLHALFDDAPERASPYSPNSRLFLNPFYIDVAAAPCFPGVNAAGLDQALTRLRQTELIDYTGVAAAKLHGLRLAFESFKTSGPGAERDAFERFCCERAPNLMRFACFEFLRRQYREPWWQWPTPWRQPDDAALMELRARQDHAIAFFEFLQWIAHQQLDACVKRASERAMPVGLYLDVAVGVDPAGFDAWNDQDAILRTLAIGAPPDAFNPAGQNWGLAGFNGTGLARRQFAPFRALLRHSMRYAGAIRLDHVLGLNRLYVIPSGVAADKGLYLRMPLEHLLAIAADESNASRCIVIGEDLGTVPEGLRDILAVWGVWRYHVLIFERAGDGAFLPPRAYARDALVTNTTHDLPTFAAWCAGADLRLRQSLGLDPGESDEDRNKARAALTAALAQQGFGPLSLEATVRFMSATPSRLLMISIDDVLGLTDQPNVPGTIHEHPNWRRRLPVDLDRLARWDALAAVAQLLNAGGRAAR
jgi:4-alpha-glucanotransferase